MSQLICVSRRKADEMSNPAATRSWSVSKGVIPAIGTGWLENQVALKKFVFQLKDVAIVFEMSWPLRAS